VLPRKDWRADLVLLFIAPLVGLMLLGVADHLFGAREVPAKPAVPMAFGEALMNTLVFQGGMLVGMGFFLRAHDMGVVRAFGIARGTSARAIAWGLGAAVVVLPVAYGLQWLSIEALTRAGLPAGAQTPVELLLRSSAWWQRAYLAFFAIGLAPLAEESLFRGVLYPFVRDLGFPRAALWGSAVFFGLIHVNAAAFLPLSFFGLVLAWLYQRTGSLLASVTAHALFNLAPFVMLALGIEPGGNR